MAIGSLIPHKFKVKGKSARSGNLSRFFYLPFFGAQKRPLSAPIPDFTSQSPSVFPAFRARFFACQLRPSRRTALRNLSHYILWFPPIGIPIHLSEKSVRSDRSGRAELPHPNRTLPPHRPRLLPTAPPDRRRLRGRSAAYRLGSQQPKRPKGAGAPPLIHPRTSLSAHLTSATGNKVLAMAAQESARRAVPTACTRPRGGVFPPRSRYSPAVRHGLPVTPHSLRDGR